MFRKIKRAGITRTACFALAGSLAWLAGPCQLAQAATLKTPAEVARAAGQARLLNETERRAIRGSATWPGTPRPWQYSVPTLGGYGVVNCFSGNHQISIPVVAYGGKGIPTAFALYHNSAATTQAPPAYPGGSSGMQAAPPIANGWRHSYHVLLEGAGTTTVTVVEGDGTRNSFTQNVNGSFTAPAGVWDTLVRNVNLTYTLTRKGGLKVNFGTNNRLASLVDLNGNTTSVAYGANGEVSTVTDAAGRVLTLAYNASKQLTTITDPASRVFTLTYSNNLLQRVTFPAPATGAAQPYFEFVTDSTYASITSFRNRRGSVWSLSWGNSGGDMQCFGGMTDPATKTVSMNWGMRQVTRENGAIYTWTSDAGGNRASVQLCPDVYHMMAETQSWTWDSQRNLLTEVKGSGNTWTYTYDSRGNQLTVEDPITAADPNVVKQTTTYNSLDLPASSTDALGHTTSYTYDVKGNLTKVVDPLLHETTHTYSTAGQRLTTTDPRLKVWETVYDTTGNATQQKDPLLNTTTTAYTTLGWPTTVTDPTGVQNTTSYDNLGRVSRVTHVADSSYVEKTYDGEDAVLTERDENARVTTNAYHAMGWLSSTTDAKSQVTSFAYNPMGQRTSLTNARNKTTTWTLDNGGRAVKTTYPDATTEESTYNANGDVATRKDGRGNIVTSGYDTVGRLTNMTYPTGTGTSFTYLANDARSTLTDRTGTTTWTYNARGETTQVNAPQGTITTGYDAARNRTSVSRTGGISLTYVYDNASRLASQGNGYGETTSYTLDAAGRITQQVQGNGTKVLSTYATGSTGRGWLTVLEHRQSTNAVLARYEYTRGLTGHTTIATQPGNHSVTYTYDNVYQLTAEVRTGSSPYSYSYSYDATSNRLTKVSGGVTTTSTYGDNNQILTSGGKTYSHDADGNMTGVTSGGTTTTLAWDYNQKLTGITYPGGATNSFVTNDLGNRVSKVDSGGTTTSLYDGSSVLADSRADYTQGGVTGLISERASGTSKYYHGDQ
ncbi:MAG TPA: hypothetical protein VK689_21660, partial [Armatimonadota bacterium]|nr:hypothetical protein [Armatimonadota bacterium]